MCKVHNHGILLILAPNRLSYVSPNLRPKRLHTEAPNLDQPIIQLAIDMGINDLVTVIEAGHYVWHSATSALARQGKGAHSLSSHPLYKYGVAQVPDRPSNSISQLMTLHSTRTPYLTTTVHFCPRTRRYFVPRTDCGYRPLDSLFVTDGPLEPCQGALDRVHCVLLHRRCFYASVSHGSS